MNSVQNEEDFQPQKCFNCGEEYPKIGLQEHMQQCFIENVVSDCNFCGESILLNQMESHLQICGSAINGDEDDFCEYCKEKIYQKFKQEHYQDCPLKLIEDSYKSQQCHECSICLMNIGPTDVKGILECAHIFHEKCIEEWKMKSKECPICRFN